MDLRELRRRQHGRRGALPRLRDLALHDPTTDPLHLIASHRPRVRRRPIVPSRTVALLAIAAVVAVAAVITFGPVVTLAADPTQGPAASTPAPPTCAERFPAEGPAGVDLRLGCIVGEVVGLYTAGQATPPAPLSTYAIVVAALVLVAVIAVWLLGKALARRASRRLAPVLASEWWVCASCRSVNAAGVARCYSCGSDRPDGPMLRTDEHPEVAQSFGSTRKRG